MHTYFFNTIQLIKKNYLKIYDVNGKIISSFIMMSLLLLSKVILEPAPQEYLDIIKKQQIIAGIDYLFDYIVPLISSYIIAYVFYLDYKTNVYELMEFYSDSKINLIILLRWVMYIILFIISTCIMSLIYYRKSLNLDIKSLMLVIRFIPNIIFINSLMLFLISLSKEVFSGIFLITTYIICDYYSSGHLFKIFSIGANMNNFYNKISPEYYIINRIILLIISFICIYFACKKPSISIRKRIFS